MTAPRHDAHTLAAAGLAEDHDAESAQPTALDLIRVVVVEQRRFCLQFAAFAESLYPELRRRVRIKCPRCGHEHRHEVGELR